MKRRVLLSLSPTLLSLLSKPSRLVPCTTCGVFHFSPCIHTGGKPNAQV